MQNVSVKILLLILLPTVIQCTNGVNSPNQNGRNGMDSKSIFRKLNYRNYIDHTLSLHSMKGGLQGRIVGGNNVYQGEKPFQVWLAYRDDELRCGGSLVEVYGVQLVITAGHCVFLGWPDRRSTKNPAYMTITAGDVRLSDTTGYEQKRGASKIVMHEGYDPSWFENDLALIFLTSDFDLNDYVNTIDLPEANALLPNTVEVSGWGSKDVGWEVLNHLQKLEVPILEHQVCKEYDWGANSITTKQFCVGHLLQKPTSGACTGDSGGPAIKKGPGREVLIGVVSYNIYSHCGSPLYPSVFLRVSKYMDWIRERVSDHIQEGLQG